MRLQPVGYLQSVVEMISRYGIRDHRRQNPFHDHVVFDPEVPACIESRGLTTGRIHGHSWIYIATDGYRCWYIAIGWYNNLCFIKNVKQTAATNKTIKRILLLKMYVVAYEIKRRVKSKMGFIIMFVAAVCFMFLIKSQSL